MATNGGFDPIASYARLSERVEGQGRDIVDLRSNMNTGFRNIEGSIKALSDQLSAGSRTQWPVIWSAIGVCFAVLAGLGGALYLPVREAIAETKSDVRNVSNAALSVSAFADFKNTYETNRIVSRTEYLDKFNNAREDLAKTEGALQRQIDDLKASQGSVYGARDALLDMRERLDRLEQSRRLMPSP